MKEILLTAAWIAPMTGPPMRDSGVVFRDNRIASIGTVSSLRRSHPDAEIHDLGNSAILPGLVNAHTHLELSLIQRGPSPKRFVDWIIELVGRAGPPAGAEAVRVGIKQCLRFGVTSIGDITIQPQVSREALASTPMRGVSYGEVRAMAQRRGYLESRLDQSRAVPARSGAARPGSVAAGISPHAPYSVEIDGYQRCLETAREYQLPLATHLAETPDEAEFLSSHSGPFKELWDYFAAWDERVPRFTGGPIRFAQAIGLLDYPSLLAHVNYCDDAEMDLLARGNASVVYCPRTHAYFGHPPHRWREMLALGINVAVGTDSSASSPDLNVVEDLRLMHRLAPAIEPLDLWQMVTTRAAKAIQCADVGDLSAGKFADAAVFAVKTDDPLREVIEQPLLPSQVWVGGHRLVPDTESAG